MGEAYEVVDASFAAMVRDNAGVDGASRYLDLVDLEELWAASPSDDQEAIGVLAMAFCYAHHLRGDTGSSHDGLYETLEFQTHRMLFERVAETGLYKRTGLPVFGGTDDLYVEYLREEVVSRS